MCFYSELRLLQGSPHKSGFVQASGMWFHKKFTIFFESPKTNVLLSYRNLIMCLENKAHMSAQATPSNNSYSCETDYLG